jgi:ribosomal protein S18 acetylase RimI-like enzyme
MTDAMIRIEQGLSDHHRQEAALLYWQAFGPKLGRVLGPERLALSYLARVMRADHCLIALGKDGGLVGLAGFKTSQGSFAGGSTDDLRAIYGPIGGRWRTRVLQLLGNDPPDTERFLLDGLCVSDEVRGQGVGTALLEAIVEEGRRRGYGAVRLDVVDTNARARALYERRGFVLDRTEAIGPLRLIFGFNAAHTMIRPT